MEGFRELRYSDGREYIEVVEKGDIGGDGGGEEGMGFV